MVEYACGCCAKQREGGVETQNKMTYAPGVHEGKPIIMIRFKYDPEIIAEVKKLPGRQWSQSLKCWHVPDTPEYRERFGLSGAKLPSKRKLGKVSPVNQLALDELRKLLILKGYSKNTQRTYYYEFAQLLYFLGDGDVNAMDTGRIKSYLLYCAEESKMTESQIQSRINAVKFYFERVLKREKIFVDIPRPKTPSQLPKHISQRDIRKLFDAVENEKHALMLKMCYGMGLRVSEIVNLKVSDIDSGNMQALIQRGKGKKDRYVNLPESVLSDLRSYYREYHPGKYLFEGQGGGKYSIRSVQHVFKTAMEKAKINKDIGIHSLRHSYATHLLENGTDISYIQQLLGHNDIKTTMTYTRVAQKNLKNVKSPLDNL
jgi:site-specific recombinase XerD